MTHPRPGREPAAMRFHVDAWDPSYGASADADVPLDTAESQSRARRGAARRTLGSGRPAGQRATPAAVLFVDGVRRIDARVWVEDPAATGRRQRRASAPRTRPGSSAAAKARRT